MGRHVVIPSYVAFILLCGGAAIAVMATVQNKVAVYAAGFSFFALFFAVSLAILFAVLPAIRAKQAKLDLQKYDLAPYTPADGDEKFFRRVPIRRFYFTPEPFDEDESVLLRGANALNAYFEQFCSAPERFLGEEVLHEMQAFEPFFINDWNLTEQNNTSYFMEKTLEGGHLHVVMSAQYELEFREDGIVAQDKLFPYDQIGAAFDAKFFSYFVSARIVLLLGDEMAASFALGGKICALLDKYRIAVDNRAALEYSLREPERAFRQIARRGKIKIKENQ